MDGQITLRSGNVDDSWTGACERVFSSPGGNPTFRSPTNRVARDSTREALVSESVGEVRGRPRCGGRSPLVPAEQDALSSLEAGQCDDCTDRAKRPAHTSSTRVHRTTHGWIGETDGPILMRRPAVPSHTRTAPQPHGHQTATHPPADRAPRTERRSCSLRCRPKDSVFRDRKVRSTLTSPKELRSFEMTREIRSPEPRCSSTGRRSCSPLAARAGTAEPSFASLTRTSRVESRALAVAQDARQRVPTPESSGRTLPTRRGKHPRAPRLSSGGSSPGRSRRRSRRARPSRTRRRPPWLARGWPRPRRPRRVRR